jgi:hypothetical protein
MSKNPHHKKNISICNDPLQLLNNNSKAKKAQYIALFKNSDFNKSMISFAEEGLGDYLQILVKNY